MMKYIYSFIVIFYFFLIGIFFLIASSIIFALAYPFDKKRLLVHNISKFWMISSFLKANPFWKLKFSGKENVDKNKTYIIVSNHQSFIDIGMMYYVPTVFKWISKREVIKMPIVGQMLYLHGDIMIKRGNPASAKYMLQKANSWIKKGASVAIFPEGTRTKNGCVNRFKEGAFLLAKQTNTAILPVVIDGSFEALPKSGFLIKMKNTFHLKILPEISAAKVRETGIRDMARKVEKIILDEHKKIAPKYY